MPFDYTGISEWMENRSPTLANRLSMKVLGFVSPFNSHLKSKLVEWQGIKAIVEMPFRRGVKNHLGGVHAGALFTLGESCAGLVIVKNFSFKLYRPIMTEISVVYEKQARGKVRAVAETTSDELLKVKEGLVNGPQLLPMVTNIYDEQNNRVAKVNTTWQIKSWSQIKKK